MNTRVATVSSHLRGLDYSVIQQCMHCGLCLPTCPTYDATKMERNSPRGRISLMRAIADGQLEASKNFADEMYFFLGCLACMTACPWCCGSAGIYNLIQPEMANQLLERKVNHIRSTDAEIVATVRRTVRQCDSATVER